jgi:hypothetical protein
MNEAIILRQIMIAKANLVKLVLDGQFDRIAQAYEDARPLFDHYDEAVFHGEVCMALSKFLRNAGYSDTDQEYRFNAAVDAMPEARNRKLVKINYLLNRAFRMNATDNEFMRIINQITPEDEAGFSQQDMDYYNTLKLQIGLRVGSIALINASSLIQQ